MEDEINIVSEDCFKNLKKLVKKAIQFQKHSRRVKLTVADIELANRYFFKQKSEISSTENVNIDLESYIEQKERESTCITYSAKCLPCPKSMLLQNSKMDKDMEDCFIFTIKALFTKSNSIYMHTLCNLHKNSSVLPLLPIFLDSLCNNYILMQYDAFFLGRIVTLMYSLYSNHRLHFRNQDIYKLITFLLSLITSNLPAMFCEQNNCCTLQNNATKFLYQIILKYPESKFIYDYSLNKLQTPLESSEIKLQQCYGALHALIEINLPAVARVIPRVFLKFSQKLKREMSCNNFSQKQLDSKCHEDPGQNMADAVHTKLLDACELLINHYLHESTHSTQIRLDHCCTFSNISNSYICEEVGNESVIFETCKNILDYFGNMLISRLPSLKDKDKLNGKSLLEYFTGTTILPEVSKDKC